MNKQTEIFNKLTKSKWMVDILFWVCVYFLDVLKFFGIYSDEPFLSILVYSLSTLLPSIVGAYFLYLFAIPYLYLQKRYFLFYSLSISSLYIISAYGRILMVHVAETLVRQGEFEQESIWEILTDWKILVIKYFPAIYLPVFMFLFMKFVLYFKKNEERRNNLEKEKSIAELNALKSQLNPHFLFNTLNNIYLLAIEKSPKIPEVIEKLSAILDHILYRCNSEIVPISSEITLLENYISLEKLRYDERLEVIFDKEIKQPVSIAPLILLSLVENAFKHGAGEDSGSPKIRILLKSENSRIDFQISNTISESKTLPENKNSIGLLNIRKQLDLIYPNNYNLEIIKGKSLFTVKLELGSN
ncbi:sensor histidine kinase [Aureivirga sp. CE67]|uniref:sensor histidine kinase n=1 Tax=Aureivirga sp. CE67 TaxID=1788983 RepID=UPI001E3C7228|nr:histidine kinase [Aureivirga sp. CE67]